MTATPSNLPLSEASADPAEENVRDLVIQPLKGWIPIDWTELLRYRELLFFFIWRDIKVRYKQAVLGAAWAVLQPVISACLFVLIFQVLLGLGKNLPVPYFVYVFAGLLPWMFFSQSVNLGGSVLINQQHMLTKIYFPRIFLPTAAVGANWVDLAISFGVLLCVMPILRVLPSIGILAVPFLIVLTVIMSLGFVYFLSALTVLYRDFEFITPFMLQIMSYASFVQYPVPEDMIQKHVWVGYVLALNPMFGVVNAFRASIIGTSDKIHWHPEFLGISVLISLVMFLVGLFYFRRTERRFADVA
jgi:lipopolysaccharide transport system permease protein